MVAHYFDDECDRLNHTTGRVRMSGERTGDLEFRAGCRIDARTPGS